MSGETDIEAMPIEKVFRLMGSNDSEVVTEIQRYFYELLSETKEPWLVSGLYDHHVSTRSMHSLRLLLSVKEPQDKFLCDRLQEGLRSSSSRGVALNILGYIVRKQPTWLHKVAHHPLFIHLLKLLRTDTDVLVLVPGLLVLLSLLPSIFTKLGPHLTELFEIFGRLAALSRQEAASLDTQSSTHLTVSLYAYFHRLYGMFPCNLLSWLRTQYPEANTASTSVFTEVISPLLSSVRLHPLLVTQSRDQEKTAARWRGIAEVHDVVAECSRYCLDMSSSTGPDIHIVSRKVGGRSKVVLDSPPEAAIEATPDNTPYATPVKESPSRQPRPSSQHSQHSHIRHLSFKSPGPFAPPSPSKTVTSPGQDVSPFRWPEPDSVFQEVPPNVLSKRDSLGLGLVLVQNHQAKPASDPDADGQRPEPVKFTKELAQLQHLPLKPNVENLTTRYNMNRDKLLSVHGPENLENKETDAEVSQLTASVDSRTRNLSSRHITPHMFAESPRIQDYSPAKFEETPGTAVMTSVNEMVQTIQKRHRVRGITLCEDTNSRCSPSQSGYGSLTRTSSCPAIDLAVTKPGEEHKPETDTRPRSRVKFSSATQTDPGVAPSDYYEHLFPLVLPNPPPPTPPVPRPNPDTLLDSYIAAAVEKMTEGSSIQQAEMKMLQSHLQFEVGRREVLGARNRRLLGVSKGVREMEEQNLSLKDQLMVMKQEVANLHTQLASVRNSKHQTETERAEASKVQLSIIQGLQSRVEDLEMVNRQVEERAQDKERVARQALADCDQARGELFQAQAKLDRFHVKETSWTEGRKEAEQMKKQLVLQGELLERYKERLAQLPVAGREEEKRILQEAANNEVTAAKNELLWKQQELTATKARVEELEGKVLTLQGTVTRQEEVMEALQEEHTEKLNACQERYGAIRSVNALLEGNILELQERLERVLRGGRRGGARKGASPSTEGLDDVMSMGDTVGPDLSPRQDEQMSLGLGSSSLVGSQGSDTGEYIRRAVDSPPVQLGLEASLSVGSAPVGSAHSALHVPGIGGGQHERRGGEPSNGQGH